MIVQGHHEAEARRQAIQTAIDATRSASERNRYGQFATPNILAVEIARFVASVMDTGTVGVHFADPAVGTGSFFSAALETWGQTRIRSAIGIEVDPAFAEAARDLWSDAGLKVVQGDFTRLVGDRIQLPPPNLILANPPYVRHHHMNRTDKQRLQLLARQMTGIQVNGLAGLYVYFLLISTAWMEDGGYAAWLIPSEFMDVNYGAALKCFLTDRVTLIRAHRFDPHDMQFGDALVSSVVLVFRKAPPPPTHTPEFTFGGSITDPCAADRVPLDRLRQSRKWTAFPRHATNNRHTLSDEGAPTLSGLFRIRRGIATGHNKFFILDRTGAERRDFPARYLRPILPSPRFLKVTVIDGDDDGYPLVVPQLCVIDCDLPEHLLEHRHPALWEYLRTADSLGVKEGYLVGKRRPWYKQEQREAAPFLCTYMGRGANDKQPVRFVLNRSRAIGTNLYLMLYPRGSLAAMLREHPDRDVAVHELLGRVTGHELRGVGRVYGGGLNKIEPSELGRVSAASFVERWPQLRLSVWRENTPSLFD